MKLKEILNNFLINAFPKPETDPKLDNVSGFFKVGLICIIEFVFLMVFFPLVYEISDDFAMNSLASGALTGEPSEYLYFTNVLIGKILKLFYSIVPQINWYTFYMLSSLLISYSVVQFVFYRLKTHYSVRAMRHLFILITYFSFLITSGFTRVAAITAAAGFIIIFLSADKKVRQHLAGFLLLVLAALMRHHVFLMYVLLAAPFLVVLIIKKKYRKLFFIGLAIIVFLGAKAYDSYVYKQKEELAFHMKYLRPTAALYKPNKPNYTNEYREKQRELKTFNELETRLLDGGMLHLSRDSIENKDFSEVLVKKKTALEKTFAPDFIKYLKKTFYTFWDYIDSHYYQFIPLLVLLLIFVGKRPYELITIGIYALYILLIAFYLYYYREGVLKPRVLISMITPFMLLSLYYLDKNSMIPDNLPFLSGINKTEMGLIGIVFTMTVLITNFKIYKTSSISTYSRRDAAHKVLKYLDETDTGFQVRKIIHNPYYIYKNPFDQTHTFRFGWLAFSPSNRKAMKDFCGNPDASIYHICNKDIVWYFDSYLYNRDAEKAIAYYRDANEICFVNRIPIKLSGRARLNKITFFIAEPDSSDYTLYDIDTTLFNASDSTYYKILKAEEYSESDEGLESEDDFESEEDN